LTPSNEGEARIEIRGANLAAEGSSVTIDGKAADIVSRCNATASRTCKTDTLTILAPELKPTRHVRIVVTSGARSSPPFSVLIPKRDLPKP
jgi:hypothetical protein